MCDRNIPYFDYFNDNEYTCLSIVSHGSKYLKSMLRGLKRWLSLCSVCLHKHGPYHQNLRTQLNVAAHICNPRIGGMEISRVLGLAGQPASSTWWIASQWESLSEYNGQHSWAMTYEVVLCPPFAHVQKLIWTCMDHTCVHAHTHNQCFYFV